MYHSLIPICVALSIVANDVAQATSTTVSLPQIPNGLTIHKVIRTWDEADQHCKENGAVLASPISTELLDAMRALIAINNTPYFIGTRSNDSLGLFKSREAIPLDHMPLAVSQMTDQLDPRDGDCLSMDQHSIRAMPCCARLPYMCHTPQLSEALNTVCTNTTEESGMDKTSVRLEPDLEASYSTEIVQGELEENKPTSPKPTQCGTDDQEYKFYESTGSCYKIHTDHKVWDDASATCQAEHGHLLVIDDDNEAQVIKQMNLDDLNAFVFIGLRDFTGRSDWKSVTNKGMDEIYNNWHFGQPKNIEMQCGVIYPSGLLDNLYCNTDKAYICEKKP